jgi:hypothetical protein
MSPNLIPVWLRCMSLNRGSGMKITRPSRPLVLKQIVTNKRARKRATKKKQLAGMRLTCKDRFEKTLAACGPRGRRCRCVFPSTCDRLQQNLCVEPQASSSSSHFATGCIRAIELVQSVRSVSLDGSMTLFFERMKVRRLSWRQRENSTETVG